MIVAMQKVTLLCVAHAREDSLRGLRELGVLHLDPFQPPDAPDVEADRRALARCESAILYLQSQRRPSSGAEPPALPPPASIIDRAEELAQSIGRLEEQIRLLAAGVATCEPLGEFDPALVERLCRQGLSISLWRLPRRQTPAAPENVVLTALGADQSFRYFAAIGREPFAVEGATPVPLPATGLASLRKELEARQAERREAVRASEGLAGALPALRAHYAKLAANLEFSTARAGMGASGNVTYLQGFCPEDRIDELRTAARKFGWGLALAAPAEDDRVPTLIRNPPWIRSIRYMFDLIGVTPGYREADISASFLVFYSLFFAMLVGDAGYGLLFLGLTALIRLVFRRVPRDLTRLLVLLSVSTIVWGVLTGTYFSITPLPPLLESVRVDWLRDERNVMTLCFLIGAIHLTLAHVWNAFRTINSTVAIAQLGWIAMTWTMYFLARNMILDYPLPACVKWVFLAGFAAILLFMTPLKAMKTEWPNHVMLPLTIINNFGDVVSYVRLFAVGSAGVAISVAFNEIAIGQGVHTFGAGLIAALILFAAHTLNILLCALAVIVHGVRLNTLEFCGHMGIQWTGFKYRPFALETNAEAGGASATARIGE